MLWEHNLHENGNTRCLTFHSSLFILCSHLFVELSHGNSWDLGAAHESMASFVFCLHSLDHGCMPSFNSRFIDGKLAYTVAVMLMMVATLDPKGFIIYSWGQTVKVRVCAHHPKWIFCWSVVRAVSRVYLPDQWCDRLGLSPWNIHTPVNLLPSALQCQPRKEEVYTRVWETTHWIGSCKKLALGSWWNILLPSGLSSCKTLQRCEVGCNFSVWGYEYNKTWTYW